MMSTFTTSMIHPKRRGKEFCLALILLVISSSSIFSQPETMASGSFIVNMGISPQTTANALKPYGLVYDLTKNYQVPVKWSIEPSKAKDGADFIYSGVTFRGGTFIIPAEFRTAAVNARITYWQGQGVQGVTTTSAVTVPVYATIRTAVRWTLDSKNGKIAQDFFTLAGIPSTAYDWKDPQALNSCNDIFAMPHAEPQASTHGNLVTWNNNYKGTIWVGCKAGSETENNVGNFLSSTGCVPSDDHGDLSGGASYAFPADLVMQFLGTTLHTVQTSGAEQIYYPATTWRPTTRVGIFQSSPANPVNQQRALLAYGRGFGDPNRGWVCMTASHDIAKSNGPDNVAAIRTFFNFSLLAAIDRTIAPSLGAVPQIIPANTGTSLTFTLSPSGGSFTQQWTSSCGGTFSPNATASTVTYTPPAGATSCIITVKITDACGREYYDSKSVGIGCTLTATRTVTPVTCNGGSNGSIGMAISGGAAPYSWNWSRVSPAGTGSGSGTTISGLQAGTYNVTVTSPEGCSAQFSSSVSQPNVLTATPTATNINCLGQTGGISLAVNGGTTPYSYQWADLPGNPDPKDRTGIAAGAYSVTVSDANGCTTNAASSVTAPASVVSVALAGKTDATCNASNGALNITASGGTPGYSYAWNGGITTEDRTGLAAGTYIVTVTDANGCTASRTDAIVNVSTMTVSITKTNPTCPPSSSAPFNSNGAIQVTVTGGMAPYNISWTGTSSGNPAGNEIAAPSGSYTLSNLIAGTYNLTVTDGNGCTSAVSATLVNLSTPPNAPTGIN
ncbi:MAG: SprB repeat-containing protein [Lewinellaceae bacterium]|nr:SprB repeat-containing protein [Saprospiraceae bacterium]MCB9341130.1 SprB repeat-containing protein [Lewinellaceae bacterium]